MHFIAVCSTYPEFRFVVPGIRQTMAARNRSAVVSFTNGILNTEKEGFTKNEASIIARAITRLAGSPPVYGRDISIVQEEQEK